MNKKNILRWIKILYISISLLIIPYLIYSPYSPGIRQKINMQMAKEIAKKLHLKMAGDPRFSEIEARKFTDRGGCLFITGMVATDQDALALREILDFELIVDVPVYIQLDIKSRGEPK